MKAKDFYRYLVGCGFDFFSGVPCSYLSALCDEFHELQPSMHIAAVREDIAVGLAAGAYLAGKLPLVYMQNAGLGYSLEAIASLHMIYKIPVLVVMSYRGPDDAHMEEHLVMGQHCESLLKEFGVPYSIISGTVTREEIERVKSRLVREQMPYFYLVRKGALT